jgi:hypothetical protein
MKGKEKYRVEVFALQDLDSGVDIKSTWETIRENVKISAKESLEYYELRKRKPWYDEGCSKLLDNRERAKLQWLQNPNEVNTNNLNNIRCKSS